MSNDKATTTWETTEPDDPSTLGPTSNLAGANERETVSAPGRGGSRGIRQILYKIPGSREQIPATHASQTEISQINATTVLLDRSGSEQITADRVSLDRSGARTMETKSAQLDRSGVVALGSDHTVLLHSSAVQVVAEDARLSDSSVVFLSSDNVTLENSRVIIFNGSATGDVQTVVTSRTAVIVAGILGAALILLALLTRNDGDER